MAMRSANRRDCRAGAARVAENPTSGLHEELRLGQTGGMHAKSRTYCNTGASAWHPAVGKRLLLQPR